MRHLKLIRLDSRHTTDSSSTERPVLVRRTGAAEEDLTPRELEVEDLLCRGYSQENIAAIFGRSVNTVSTHALSLYRKRGVHTQVGLLLAYLEREGIFAFTDEVIERSPEPRTPSEAADKLRERGLRSQATLQLDTCP